MLGRRRLGKTELLVSAIGLGGNGIMRTHGCREEAAAVVHRALELGINYFDAARVYAGCEDYLGWALRGRRDGIFLASKTAERTRDGARRDLETTLRTLRTSYLDVYEIHDLRTHQELDRIIEPDGALAALEKARQEGLVRFVGITAHYDPTVLGRAMSLYSYDTCMLPVNIAEPHYDSFPEQILPIARQSDMGVIGMKALCGGVITPAAPLLRHALSQPVSTLLVGVAELAELEENVRTAAEFEPMPLEEMEALVEYTAPHAMRLMYYKKKRTYVFSLN